MMPMWITAFLLALTITSGRLSLITQMPIIDEGILKCLKGAGFLDQAFTVMSFNSTTHLWSAFTTPEMINNAGTIPDIILNLEAIRWASFSPETYSD